MKNVRKPLAVPNVHIESGLASKNIKRESSPQQAKETRKGMEHMSELYREKREQFYLREGEAR